MAHRHPTRSFLDLAERILSDRSPRQRWHLLSNLRAVGIDTAQDLLSLNPMAFEITLASSLIHWQLADAVRLRQGFASICACDRAIEDMEHTRASRREEVWCQARSGSKGKGQGWQRRRSHSPSPSGGKGKGLRESHSQSRGPRRDPLVLRNVTVISKQ